jgi:two-component system response regulator GlrR
MKTREQLNADLGLRILLVEDHIDIREALQVVLESEGYSVVGAGSAEEGLQHLGSGRFHLILSDYSLPGGTGAWMVSEARRRGIDGNAAALIVTAHPEPAGTEGLRVMRKPLDVDDFLRVVNEVMAPAREAEFERARVEVEEGARPQERPPRVELVLYVSSRSPASLKATRALHRLLQRYPAGSISLTIRDLARAPHEVAEEDRVAFTPTLVKRAPEPRAWVLGDLDNIQIVIDLLAHSGLEPNQP